MPIEDLIFYGGGGFLFGILAGYAIKKVMKIAAIIIGLFVVALAYLSYRGLLDVKWAAMENVTRHTLTNAYEQTFHVLNSTSICYCNIGITASCWTGICTRIDDGIEERINDGGVNKRVNNIKHDKLTNFLLKIHILEEGSYRDDMKRRINKK